MNKKGARGWSLKNSERGRPQITISMSRDTLALLDILARRYGSRGAAVDVAAALLHARDAARVGERPRGADEADDG
jgi:hypothetical protein